MKGIIKSLKYFSQIFDEDKEPEMQIGFPTDVKHVAHIGLDGPSSNTPSWMNDFKETEPSSLPVNLGEEKNHVTKLPLEDKNQCGNGVRDSLPPLHNEKKHKSRRKPSTGTGSPLGSPTKMSSDGSKPSRHNRSSNNSMDSKDSSSRRGRRHSNASPGYESSSQDQPAMPKQSRHRKSKGSSGGESTRSSRSKGGDSLEGTCPFTDLGTGYEINNVSKDVNEDSTFAAQKQ